jgi:hypothetical protein
MGAQQVRRSRALLTARRAGCLGRELPRRPLQKNPSSSTALPRCSSADGRWRRRAEHLGGLWSLGSKSAAIEVAEYPGATGQEEADESTDDAVVAVRRGLRRRRTGRTSLAQQPRPRTFRRSTRGRPKGATCGPGRPSTRTPKRSLVAGRSQRTGADVAAYMGDLRGRQARRVPLNPGRQSALPQCPRGCLRRRRGLRHAHQDLRDRPEADPLQPIQVHRRQGPADGTGPLRWPLASATTCGRPTTSLRFWSRRPLG